MYANEAIELMSRKDLQDLQLKRLQKEIKWACSKSSYYQKKFTEAGVGVPVIQQLTDIEELPFTTKQELAMSNPMDLLTLPLSGIMRVSRQGNMSKRISMYTNGDIAQHVEMLTRVLVAYGINNTSLVGILWDLSDSRILDVQYALESVGAGVVMLGADYDNAVEILKDFHVDCIVSDFRQVTQLMVHMQALQNTDGIIGAVVDELNTVEEFKVPLVLCFEENMQNPMRTYIERRLSAQVYSVYNSPGLGCSGVLFPCGKGAGLHIMEDYFYPEIVEFGGDKVIHDPAIVGELVLTTLTAEAMPVIRLRTGQTVMRLDEPCKCGRTLMRVAAPTEYFSAF